MTFWMTWGIINKIVFFNVESAASCLSAPLHVVVLFFFYKKKDHTL